MFHHRDPTTQIWGIDMIISETDGNHEAYLIEVNTFPQLYRGDTVTDAAVDAVLRDEVFAVATCQEKCVLGRSSRSPSRTMSSFSL